MKTLLRKGLFLATTLSLCSSISQAQESDSQASGSYIQKEAKIKLADNYRGLSLNDAIEQALRRNYSEKERVFDSTLLDLEWEGTWNEFWLPSLNLRLTTTPHTVMEFWDGKVDGGKTSKRPSGSFGLEFEDYTIFNWGKDYLVYLNKKASYKRSKEILTESKRELKHDIIIEYFKLKTAQELTQVKKEQLRQASFIYRLNKERISLKKTTRNDYYLSRSEYLRAQEEYHQAKLSADTQSERLASLLDDPMGTVYVLRDELSYKLINTSLSEAVRLAKENNPAIKTANTLVQNAQRELDLAVKENIPLPKISVNLGTYKRHFSEDTNRTIFRSGEENSNIEVVASINATWAITGKNGLFNSRSTKIARVSKHRAFNQKAHAHRSIKGVIRNHYKSILQLQNQISILEARLPTTEKLYDSILEKYINKKVKYYDLHLTLLSFNETSYKLKETFFYHLKEKIQLAKAMGIEDFPGENFERLASPVSSKKEGN